MSEDTIVKHMKHMRHVWVDVVSGEELYDTYQLDDEGDTRTAFRSCMVGEEGPSLYEQNPDRVVMYRLWGSNRKDEQVLLGRFLMWKLTDEKDRTVGWQSSHVYHTEQYKNLRWVQEGNTYWIGKNVYDGIYDWYEMWSNMNYKSSSTSPDAMARVHYARVEAFPYEDKFVNWFTYWGDPFLYSKEWKHEPYLHVVMRSEDGYVYWQEESVIGQENYGDDESMNGGDCRGLCATQRERNPILKDWNYQPTPLNPFPDVTIPDKYIEPMLPFLYSPYYNPLQPTLATIMEEL